MFNAAGIAEKTITTEQALQKVDTNQKLIKPGVNERIAQALILTRERQTEKMARENLSACLFRLSILYDMNNYGDAGTLTENIVHKNPQDLKVIYADIIKDAHRKVYTGWTIVFIYNIILISASIAFCPIFLILTALTIIILPILYDSPIDAGSFLIDTKKLKKIIGEDYCPFELIEQKRG